MIVYKHLLTNNTRLDAKMVFFCSYLDIVTYHEINWSSILFVSCILNMDDITLKYNIVRYTGLD